MSPDPAEVAASLRAVLDALDASPVERARIEGAVVALDVMAGADPATIATRLRTEVAPR